MARNRASLRRDQEAEAWRNLERLANLGAISAGVAHDFNNLLTVILGRCEVLLAAVEGGAPVGELRRHLEVIRQVSTDGASLVRRLQRSPLGQGDVADLGAVLRDAIEYASPRWKHQAARNGIRFDVRLDLAPVPQVRLDAPSLREVLVNLIFNALDAMPAGGRLELHLRREDGVVIDICDTGTGIAPEHRGRLFEPYFTTRSDGTGIGLAVCRELVTQMGGWIEVQSTLGEGTTMRLCLPFVPAEAEVSPD